MKTRVKKNNREKGELGTILAIAGLVSSLIGGGVSIAQNAKQNKLAKEQAAEQQKQFEAQMAAAEQNRANQQIADNEAAAMQAAANQSELLNYDKSQDLETLRTNNIATLTSKGSQMKCGGSRKMACGGTKRRVKKVSGGLSLYI